MSTPTDPSVINYVLGISVLLIGSAVSSIGLNIQAAALKDEHSVIDEDATVIEKLWFKYRWYIGFLTYLVFSAGGSAVALAFISVVVMATLSSLGLIFNIFSSYWLLGAKIKRSDWVGTLYIVVGCALVSYVGSSVPDEKNGTEKLIKLFKRPAFIINFSIQLGLIVILTVYALWESSRLSKIERDSEENQPLLMSRSNSQQVLSNETNEQDEEEKYVNDGDLDGILIHEIYNDDFDDGGSTTASEEDIQLIPKKDTAKHDRVGIIYGIVSAVLGSQSLLLAKSGVGLLILSFKNSKNQFESLFSLFLLSMLITICLWQLFAFNKALYHTMPTLVIPISHTIYTCMSLFNSLIYLNQLSTGVYGPLDFVCFVIGIGILSWGVWLLRHRQ